MLYDLYRQKFGDYLPLIRRQDVKGFIHAKKPLWLMRPLGLDEVRKFAEDMEFEAECYYRKAAANARDAIPRGNIASSHGSAMTTPAPRSIARRWRSGSRMLRI